MIKKSVFIFSASNDFVKLMRIRLGENVLLHVSSAKNIRSDILKRVFPCCVIADSLFLEGVSFLELIS